MPISGTSTTTVRTPRSCTTTAHGDMIQRGQRRRFNAYIQKNGDFVNCDKYAVNFTTSSMLPAAWLKLERLLEYNNNTTRIKLSCRFLFCRRAAWCSWLLRWSHQTRPQSLPGITSTWCRCRLGDTVRGLIHWGREVQYLHD